MLSNHVNLWECIEIGKIQREKVWLIRSVSKIAKYTWSFEKQAWMQSYIKKDKSIVKNEIAGVSSVLDLIVEIRSIPNRMQEFSIDAEINSLHFKYFVWDLGNLQYTLQTNEKTHSPAPRPQHENIVASEWVLKSYNSNTISKLKVITIRRRYWLKLKP